MVGSRGDTGMTNSARDTLDIETAGAVLVIDTEEDHVLDLYVRGDAATDYALDVSDRNSQWITDADTYAATAMINQTIANCARYIRLRVTAGTATAGQTATVLMTSAGGD